MDPEKSPRSILEEDFWGKLVSINGNSENLTLEKKSYIIGKGRNCHIRIKCDLINDIHFTITRESEDEIIL
jgi:hypothetical protein